jgi:opacity protein-like surface antigen
MGALWRPLTLEREGQKTMDLGDGERDDEVVKMSPDARLDESALQKNKLPNVKLRIVYPDMEKMKGTGVPPNCRVGGLKFVVCIIVLATCAFSRSFAGTDMKQLAGPTATDKEWTVELGSGVTWSNVRSGQPNQAYTIVPINLTASLKLDDVGLDNFLNGWVRGYSEFFFRGDYEQIVHGPENHVEDFIVGPRYNFVQPGWKLIPYAEGGVGVAFADSNPALGGLGQDFNFTFTVGAGAKYQINDDWFVRAGVEYQHVSNAGLSEPQFPNHPIDALGPKISVGYSF